MWKEIINDFKKIGLNIDNLFLENISNKNFNYIKSKIELIPLINHYFNENDKKIIFTKKNKIYTFDILGFICKGSSNQTYLIKNNSNDKLSVYRCALSDLQEDIKIINNFIECFIHSFLSIIDEKYLINKNKIMKLRHLGYNPKYKFISIFVDKMDGTLYTLLTNKDINFKNKLIILLQSLYDITTLLIELQDKFKFVHHDLKCDNIFYKYIDNKYIFYLGDFDDSRIEIKNYIIKSQKTIIPDNDFYYKKDLFILTNSLYYSFNDKDWKDNFFYKFPIIQKIKSQEQFHTLYNYKDEEIDNIYIPANYKVIIKSLIKKLI